jgi:hypothetical protein
LTGIGQNDWLKEITILMALAAVMMGFKLQFPVVKA